MTEHFDPETLAAFAEGNLAPEHRGQVVAHLDACEQCLNEVALVMPAAREEAERSRFRRRPVWLLAVAALVIAIVAVPVTRQLRRTRSPFPELVAAMPADARPVEARLSGGFPWAAYHGPMRASNATTNTAELKLGGAAAEMIERAERDKSADAQHAAGVAMVLIDKPSDALARLEAAAAASNDAKTWSDLAAARYTAAVQGEASLLPRALAAADEALHREPALPEALFNRALIVERLGVTAEARRAWQRYLEVDSGSAWAVEAQRHLAQLPVATRSSEFGRDQPLVERAALAGDHATARTLVGAYRERFRAYGEAEYLGRWAEAEQRGDRAGAERWLTIARSIGDALLQTSGEALLHDAVAAIDASRDGVRAAIAEAHVTYRRGRIAYSRREVAAGERDLRAAAAQFASAADPMSFMARHYASSARLARNDAPGARAELRQLCDEADAHPAYLALGGHVRWELARSLMNDEAWAEQLPVLAAAADRFRRGGERASEAFVESMQADAFTFVGRADDAWAAYGRAMKALSDEAQSDLLETTLINAATAELKAGRRDSALALTHLSEAVQHPSAQPVLAIATSLRRAMLEVAAGEPDGATAPLQSASVMATRLSDPRTREWHDAEIAMVRGAQLLVHDPRAALAPLSRAIDFNLAHDRFIDLPEPLLLRARARLAAGDDAAAARDLEQGIQAVERNRIRVDRAVLGTGVLDAAHALFAEAIRLHLDRNDVAAAFAYAERARGVAPRPLAELQRDLAGSGAAILEIAQLPQGVAAIAISGHDVAVARSRRSVAELATLGTHAAAGDDSAAAQLFDELIRPAAGVIEHGSVLIVVPDVALAGVPFAALLDATRNRLVERLPVVIASSASELRPPPPQSSHETRSFVAVRLPSGDAAALPDADSEIGEVASLYRHPVSVTGDAATWPAFERAAAAADVVHVAGHTERQPADASPALVFANGSGATERISWKSIVSAPPLHARVVVLAACETLRPPSSPDARALSLGAAFAAEGGDVVGTLVPIPDRDARALFRSLHQQLAAGAAPDEALRSVQLQCIRDEAGGGSPRAWRALAVMTGHLPRTKETRSK